MKFCPSEQKFQDTYSNIKMPSKYFFWTKQNGPLKDRQKLRIIIFVGNYVDLAILKT